MENFIELNTKAKMPLIGLGTWKSLPNEVGPAIELAVQSGYKHIDGAAIYQNEKEIGVTYKKIFSAGEIKREDIFITSKLWNNAHRKENVEKAYQQTLQDLQLEYLDLYLMHWGVAVPPGIETEPLDKNGYPILDRVPVRETWEAMEELFKKGLVKAIGVSNFTAPMLVDLLSYAKVVPAVNQVELHPYNAQTKLVEYCQYVGIQLTAYSPLGSPGTREEGEPVLLEDPTVVQIAQTHGKTPAQILLRWGVQRKTVVIPKTVHADKMQSNMNIFDFELSAQEIDQLNKLNKRFRYTANPMNQWRIPYFD